MPRLLTVFLTLILLATALPLMALVALALLLEGKGPVLYVGVRVGRHGRRFRMLKFRTISQPPGRPDCVAGGHQRDQITPLGQFLRRSRLDELPQLFNVLIGDLDLVGYRPPLPAYVERFPDIYGPLLAHKPGITGLASVLFHKREDRILAAARSTQEATELHARHCIPAKARLDRLYQINRCTLLDLRILALTARRLLNLPPLGERGRAGLGGDLRLARQRQ